MSFTCYNLSCLRFILCIYIYIQMDYQQPCLVMFSYAHFILFVMAHFLAVMSKCDELSHSSHSYVCVCVCLCLCMCVCVCVIFLLSKSFSRKFVFIYFSMFACMQADLFYWNMCVVPWTSLSNM